MSERAPPPAPRPRRGGARRRRALLGLCAGVVAAAGCAEREPPEVRRDVQRAHRVIEPPTGKVRSLAPFAIRADGVGPYRLGVPLASLLDPGAPRIALLDLPPVVQLGLVRGEDGGVVVGGDPVGPAAFVAVLRREVGATDSGVHVGATADELLRGLGPLEEPLARGHDPRLLAPAGLPGGRALVENGAVVALVIGMGAVPPAPAAAAPARAPAPTPRPNRRPPTRDAGVPPPAAEGCARPVPVEPAPGPRRFGACLSSGGELIDAVGDEIQIRGVGAERPTASLRVPGLRFAAALRADPAEPSSRDELIVVAESDEVGQRSWSVASYRFEPARPARGDGEPPRPMLLTKVAEQVVYQLSADKVRWIGAALADVDLYLELTARADALDVGGLLSVRAGRRLRDVAVLSPVRVARRRGRPPLADAPDAGGAPGPGDRDAGGPP